MSVCPWFCCSVVSWFHNTKKIALHHSFKRKSFATSFLSLKHYPLLPPSLHHVQHLHFQFGFLQSIIPIQGDNSVPNGGQAMDSNKNFGRKSADSNTLFENSTPNVTEPTMTGQEIPTKDYIQVPDFNSTGMDDKKPWAVLEAKHFYYKSVQLTDKSFCFGRMNNDHLFNMDYIPQSSFFDNISRKHFSIKKHSDKVTITDHSHWGTYIQKSKIGKLEMENLFNWNTKTSFVSISQIINVINSNYWTKKNL